MTFSSSGWITAMDLDFTAQSNQTLSPDRTSANPYIIGGFPFFKSNSANEVTATVLTNGTGIVMTPTAGGTDYFSGTINLPLIRIFLSSIISNFSYGMPLRLWAHNSTNNAAAQFDAATLTLESAGVSSVNYNYAFKRGFNNNNANGYITTMNINSSNQGQQNEQAFTTDNVMVMEIPRGLPSVEFRTYTGLYSNGWPAASALNPHTIYILGTQNPTTSIGAASNWSMSLGAERVNSATAFVATWAHLRVDYKPA